MFMRAWIHVKIRDEGEGDHVWRPDRCENVLLFAFSHCSILEPLAPIAKTDVKDWKQ